MKDKKIIEEQNSRRSFFLKGVLSSFTIALGNTSAIAYSSKGEEKVKLLHPDGTLVEVNKKNLPKSSGERISRDELFTWKKGMEKQKP